MKKETLETYRNERKAFISCLKLYFSMDYYKMDVTERNCWLATYIEYKREFMALMMAAMKEMGTIPEVHETNIYRKKSKSKIKA